MIILDTNVLSEPMRPRPDDRVMAWLDARWGRELWLTALTVAELRAGVAKLPAGKRRDALEEAVDDTLSEFEGRILSFGSDAAVIYGDMVGPLSAGTKFQIFDYQIGAIALANEAELATRNTKDFARFGLRLINPWDA